MITFYCFTFVFSLNLFRYDLEMYMVSMQIKITLFTMFI